MKSQKHYHWYRLVGRTPETDFVYYVEATSPHMVLKLYGGKRKIQDSNGVPVIAEFPTREKDVSLMSTHFLPSEMIAEHANPITRMVAATRYQCTCGKIHVSEFPYKSMWCTCGQKAFPQFIPETLPEQYAVQASPVHETWDIEPHH